MGVVPADVTWQFERRLGFQLFNTFTKACPCRQMILLTAGIKTKKQNSAIPERVRYLKWFWGFVHSFNKDLRYIYIYIYIRCVGRTPCSAVVNVLDWDMEANEFELWSVYCVHFKTNTQENDRNPPSPSCVLNRITAVFLHEWFGQ